MWESAATPEMGKPPQEILNRSIIDKSDLLIGILWSRLGTPTSTERSGTVAEINEFIKYKGPARAMLYFCRRDFPNDVNHEELARLRAFEKEVKDQGLIAEFRTPEEFEGKLYRHLDTKIRQLLENELPLPNRPSDKAPDDVREDRSDGDLRLRKPIDFGGTLEDISRRFIARMDEFDRLDGYGSDKYLVLAAHVYGSCAASLDRFLRNSANRLKPEDSYAVERIALRLKALAGKCDEYVGKPYPQYWKDGRQISEDLMTHVKHVDRMARS
jgi:hypothetical protein